MMPALSCPTMATSQESKNESTPSTSTSYNTYNKSVAVSAAASIRNPSVLVSWILEHKSSPYPTKEEKKVLAKQAGMTITQVSYWFANTRRRIKKLGSWIVWEESQVHHKTPVVIPHLSLFPCSDPFSTTNNLLTADYSKPNPSAGSLYHPGYPYPYPGSLCGPAGIHGFGNAPSGIWNGSTSSSPALTLSPPQLESAATFTLPPKSADACMTSPLVPHTPSYSPSFQPFTNSTCITPTSITPMLPPSAITSNGSYKSPLYGPTTGTGYSNGTTPYIPLGPPPAAST